MPNLDDPSRRGVPEGYKETYPEVNENTPHSVPTPATPGYSYNPFLRSSFPGGTTTDAVRQFYRTGSYLRRFWPAQQGSN